MDRKPFQLSLVAAFRYVSLMPELLRRSCQPLSTAVNSWRDKSSVQVVSSSCLRSHTQQVAGVTR